MGALAEQLGKVDVDDANSLPQAATTGIADHNAAPAEDTWRQTYGAGGAVHRVLMALGMRMTASVIVVMWWWHEKAPPTWSAGLSSS